MVKGASYHLGIRSLASDLGLEWGQRAIEVFTDSSAAKGIVSRMGLGKVRHFAVCQLWLQDKVNDGEVQVSQISCIDNHVGILSKRVNASTLERHLMGLYHCIMRN